ncbi:hypothetical protein Scep_017716 [Stephania cephalantha]|uniref:Uncharacterized protein n=1 Tax=Stephania cephalantha TaxID=152367 RepID=A0AAP0IQ11_9MAGN
MACSKALASSLSRHTHNPTPNFPTNFTHSPSSLSLPSFPRPSLSLTIQTPQPPTTKQVCRATEYQFPDPIPDFAESETEKFRTHLLNKLTKKGIYGDSIDEVVGVCTEILSNFLHTEYGGPGTLLVIPFIDMADTLNERGLPGGPQAARAAVVWAQKHVDKDWKEWTGTED